MPRVSSLTRWKRQNRFPTAINAAVRDCKIAIIASAFNRPLTEALVAGARKALSRRGVGADQVSVLWAPGSFELPVIAARLAGRSGHPDAIIAVGVVIRGGTTQYAVIAQAAAAGLMEVSVRTGVPIAFGVIVAETLAQARARSGGGGDNRGAEAAEAALATLSTLREMDV